MCDTYMMERLVEIRLAEARAQSARCALLASLRPHRRNLLAVVGLALIRIGRRLGGRHPEHRRDPIQQSPSLS